MELENLLIFFLIAVTIGKTPDSTAPLSLGISYLKLYGLQWLGTKVCQIAQENPYSKESVFTIEVPLCFSSESTGKKTTTNFPSKGYIQLWWLSAIVGLGPKS